MLKAPFPWFGQSIDVQSQAVAKRFWAKVDKDGPNGCWIWTASKRHKGYGAFAFTAGGKVVNGRAHRISFEIFNGKLGEGDLVLHRCDNPACLNPDHLFRGTHADNVHDMDEKGRRVPGGTYSRENYKRGEVHHAARLTEDTVRQIRRDREEGGMSYSAIAAKYGIAIGHTYRIANRKAWKHVV